MLRVIFCTGSIQEGYNAYKQMVRFFVCFASVWQVSFKKSISQQTP